jgi:hypothetical protein
MRHAAAATTAAALLALCACGGPGEPVARLVVPQSEVTLPHGSRVPFELRLEPTRELDGDAAQPLLFVHLLDAQGEVVRTFDHPLPGAWRVGEPIVDAFALHQSAIAPALPPGDYRLTVGLYDGAKRRWALATEAADVARQEYAVARVRVPDLGGSAPRFAFSPEWQHVESSGDHQTVARRWLSGDGSIEVQGLQVPATVLLLVRLPAQDPNMRLVLEEGATAPALRADTDCSGFAATVTGDGFHELAVPVTALPCRIGLDANFTALGRDPGRKLSVALEQLTWQAGAPPGTGGAAPATAPQGDLAPAPPAAGTAAPTAAPPSGS